MSLKAFHLLFIGVSVMLATFVAVWSMGQYRMDHETTYALSGAVALAFGGALAFYGAMFQRKSRSL